MPLHVELHPSNYLVYIFSLIYLLIVVSLFASAIPLVMSVGLLVLISGHCYYLFNLTIKRTLAKSITSFTVANFSVGQPNTKAIAWQIKTPAGFYQAKLLPDVYVTGYLIVMRFHVNELGHCSVLVCRDSCDTEVFRRLKMFLLNFNGLFAR